MTSGYTLPLLTILATVLPASARRGGGGSSSGSGGDGGSSSGNGSGGDGPDISIDLDLSSLEAAVFSFYIVFSLFTAIQVYYAACVFKQRTPREDFARRIPFACLLVLMTLALTTYYILGSVIIGVEGRRSFTLMDPAIYSLTPFIARIADVSFFGFLLLLTLHRRNAFIRENQQILTQEQIVKYGSPLIYKFLPLSFLGMLSVIGFIQLGLSLGEERSYFTDSYPDLIDASQAMSHLYVAFYILIVIHLIASTWSLSSMVRQTPSASYALYDQNVLSPLFRIICPTLAILTLYGFIIHIILYAPNTAFVVDIYVINLVDLLIGGFLILFMISTAIGFGRLPKSEGGDDESEDEERKVKA